MIIKSKNRPDLKDCGVPDDMRDRYRVVNVGYCQWSVVTVYGPAGTCRQTIRQSSSKNMRVGRYGRVTTHIKNKLLARLEKDLHPEVIKEVEKAKDCLNMTLAEAWDAFTD